MLGHLEAPEHPIGRATADPDPNTKTADETAELLRTAGETTDPVEHDRLVEAVVILNMPLARAIADRYQNRGVPREDLEQVAFLALTRAAREFDPAFGRPFHSYAVPCIRGSVKKYFRDQAWSVRPPRRIQELQAEIAAVRAELEQSLGRSPRIGEVAERIGADLDHVIDALSADGCYAPVSLDAPTSTDADLTLGDWLTADDAEESAAEARLLLAPVVRRLDARDRLILEMRYFRGCTQQEIADEIGVTQMHVSRLLTRVLARIRAELDEPSPDAATLPEQRAVPA